MTDPKSQIPIQPPPVNPQAKTQENVMSKITGGLSWWMGSLTGHPKARKPVAKQETQQQAPQPPVQPPPNMEPQTEQAASQPGAIPNDSVSGDIEQLKKLVGKFSTNINKSVGPVVQKGIQSGSQRASAFNRSNRKFIQTVLKVFFIVILIIVVVFIAMKFFKGGNGGGGLIATPTPEGSTVTPTPTPVVYNPTKPSVYADDPVVLKLEKDIDVLVREISGTNIKETQLNPPGLDFAISF